MCFAKPEDSLPTDMEQKPKLVSLVAENRVFVATKVRSCISQQLLTIALSRFSGSIIDRPLAYSMAVPIQRLHAMLPSFSQREGSTRSIQELTSARLSAENSSAGVSWALTSKRLRHQLM